MNPNVNMQNAVSNFVRSWQQISPCIFYQLSKRDKHRNQLNILKNTENGSVCLGKAQLRLIPGPWIYVILQYILRTLHDDTNSTVNYIFN